MLEFPAGTINEGEEPEAAALRGLEEEAGYALAEGARLRPMGAYYSLPSETNKYTHIFLAIPVAVMGEARGDTEIEKYFDMSVVLPHRVARLTDFLGECVSGSPTA